jgi:hypothetical protein
VGELVAFLLPLGGEPGDDRGRQTRTRAEELLELRLGTFARGYSVKRRPTHVRFVGVAFLSSCL